jgi:class 3 adenylate cyclase
MEPRIQFAKTSDGISIAYSVYGEGPAVILSWNQPFTHVAFDMEQASGRREIELLAQRHQVVRFDLRGSGMSQRDCESYSLDTRVRDLEAVVDALECRTATLCFSGSAGPSAITFAAALPERVSLLFLRNTWVRAADVARRQQFAALVELSNHDWDLFLETFAHVLFGWSQDESQAYARMLREAITPEVARAYWADDLETDVRHLLGQVRANTVVVVNRTSPVATVEMAQEIVAGIRGASLWTVESPGTTIPAEELARILEESTGRGRASERVQPAGSSGTAVILFADIADSTALTERLGDAAFREKARTLDEALRGAIAANGGTAIEGKLLGDGVLATFGAAREAIGCAQTCHAAADAAGLALHVGMHAGDVIREEGNVFGGAVNIAARVAGEAAAGETLVSQTVRDLARTSAGVSFEDLGDRELKGVSDPVRLYEVRWREG